MKETIRIIESKSSKFKPKLGSLTKDLLDRFTQLDADEKKTLLNETVEILSNCTNPQSTSESKTGIVIGYVQSGKTMSFTTLTALAVDNGFRIIIYFAGIKNNLLEQTTKRLSKDLLTSGKNSRVFKLFQSPTIEDNMHNRIKSALKLRAKPAILITVLKHYKHINQLTKIFQDYSVKKELQKTGVLIIDDEADQASLNTYARKNSKSEDWSDDELSTTYSSILDLRASISNHTYLQYTATPQGPLLINIVDLLSPKFHVVLTPGKAYTGGEAFFIDNPDLIITIPDSEVYHHKHNQLKYAPLSLITAVQLFLIGVAIKVNVKQEEKFLSMMVHADRKNDASKKFLGWIQRFISSWEERFNLPDFDPAKIELIKQFKENYAEAIRKIDNPPSFDEVLPEILQVILDTNIELVIQGSKEINWDNASSHILVGADMLNRGYTIEGLMVTYMPRHSIGKSNADTIQQRCRFFGYKKKYLDNCRVFLPNDSIKEYVDYVEHEMIMRKNLKENSLRESLNQLLIIDNKMNPTRNNILSKDIVKHKLTGWRQINALQHIEENIRFITSFLKDKELLEFGNYNSRTRKHRYIKLSITEIIEFLRDFKISNMPDALRKSSTIQYLRYISERTEIEYAYLFEMAYEVTEGRERRLIDKNGKLRINNIFSGRSGGYQGDKSIMFENTLCIQIHKIRLKHSSVKWNGQLLYTLGIYYPKTISHSFVGIQKEDESNF